MSKVQKRAPNLPSKGEVVIPIDVADPNFATMFSNPDNETGGSFILTEVGEVKTITRLEGTNYKAECITVVVDSFQVDTLSTRPYDNLVYLSLLFGAGSGQTLVEIDCKVGASITVPATACEIRAINRADDVTSIQINGFASLGFAPNNATYTMFVSDIPASPGIVDIQNLPKFSKSVRAWVRGDITGSATANITLQGRSLLGSFYNQAYGSEPLNLTGGTTVLRIYNGNPDPVDIVLLFDIVV
jgi:hypothetical protein